MTKSAALRLVVCAFCVCLFTAVATAQIQNGQFTGTVTDPSGAAVSKATVTVTNPATGLEVKVQTNDDGQYTARELPPGQYKITAEAEGFKTGSRTGLNLNAGTTQRVNFDLVVGARTEVVEVVGAAPLVNTEDSKPYVVIGGDQVQSLPPNGRKIFDLMQQAPGAISVQGVAQEGQGNEQTQANGVRMNFNGFLINGVSNKQLSGGASMTPIQDTVQEFQMLTSNMSAQYGNSAGAIVNLVTKAGTNDFHGSAWYFRRDDALDANQFFTNQAGEARPPLDFDQFGGSLGGPIIKDKVFFFASYQGNRLITVSNPQPILVESPAWRSAVVAADGADDGVVNRVSSLLYQTFPPELIGSPSVTLDDHVSGFWGTYEDMYCAALPRAGTAQSIASVAGITAAEIAALSALTADPTSACGGLANPFVGPVAGTFARTDFIFFDTLNIQKSREQGNLFQGDEASIRVDYNWSQNDRLFTQFNWHREVNEFYSGQAGFRGFFDPVVSHVPNAQVSYLHTFNPSLLNEFRFGYASQREAISSAIPGVPAIGFGDGVSGFGSYNGYPQTFKEHIFTFADMISITKGNHNIKVGFDARRNIENSEFNVGRPSYVFFDTLFFAADAPYYAIAGVDPGIEGQSGSFVQTQPAQLASNIRHWRNWEYGLYFQDDWKVSRRLTLNLGVRYDLYTRHSELNGQQTTFRLGPGNKIIDDITTGAGQMRDANIPFGAPGCDTVTQPEAQMAGVCGPGGFDVIDPLGGPGDHNNFGPRVGFAWDIFGNGKTSVRGGFGLSYEGTFYNALSNSRWNPPFYSFNQGLDVLIGGTAPLAYGPQDPSCGPAQFDGPPCPQNFQGTSPASATGNIQGWNPASPNLQFLTGIVLPEGIDDPYIMNWFLGIQREFLTDWVVEVNYASTAGRKLFRAENINRIPGGLLPAGTCVVDNLGRTLCSQRSAFNTTGRLNPNYLVMRNWRNQTSSSYNALQLSLKRAMKGGFQFAAFYTWSHSLDDGSSWHSGATTANGPAGGEGFTTDQTRPDLDRGNSIFDVRHRVSANWVWELPWFRSQEGVIGHILGGWQWNGAWAYQTGAHFSFYDQRSASIGGDYNLDGGNNDRPDVPTTDIDATHDMWANGWGSQFNVGGGFFTAPCLGCVGNQGRNQFVGPNFWSVDTSIFKNIKVTERVGIQLRLEAFNVLNRTNFQLPGWNLPRRNRIERSSGVGQASGTFEPRRVQLGARLTF